MDQSNTFISHPVMSPTHVLFDSSDPVTPTSSASPGEGPSRARSLSGSQPHSISNSLHTAPHPQGRELPVDESLYIPRLPTPISNASVASSRSLTPLTPNIADTPTSRVPLSRISTSDFSDISASHLPASVYSTLLGHADNAERANRDTLSAQASSRAHSPFSDAWSVGTDSSTMLSRSGLTSPITRSTSSLDDLGNQSDDDVLSLRSGMFTASDLHDDEPLSLLSRRNSDSSQRGSDSGWNVVGSRSPPEL